MNGPQDLGGMMGFGAINPDPNEPLFHADWERRLLGFTLAVGATGSWTIDQSRHARETLSPLQYWSMSYYEIWLEGLLKLLRVRGMVTARDWWAQRLVDMPQTVKRVLQAADVAAVLAKGSAYDRPAHDTAMFHIGDHIITKNLVTSGHTRLPGYARMKRGVIVAVHGCHVLPDSSGMGNGDNAQWLYGVRFAAEELWGRASRDSVCIDLWQSYLEPVA
jgi:nitrile hydratase subunit beta